MYEVFEQLLQKFGVTSYRVAKDAGVTQTTLSNWKIGKSIPSSESLQKIANFFGVSVDYLMTGKELNEKKPVILPKDEVSIAQNDTELKLLMLCRKIGDVSEEEKEDILNLFESTINLYLKAKGMNDK